MDYTKNPHMLYTHYRQIFEGEELSLLEPEHHIFYLDLCWLGRKGMRFTWAELASKMQVSVKTLMSYMDRLGDVELVRFPHGPGYSEDRPEDWIRMPRQIEGDVDGLDFDKDPDVLHEFYRHPYESMPALLTPLRHILYLDLQTISACTISARLDDIRKLYGQRLSRREIVKWLRHLKAIDLIECGNLIEVSFTQTFAFKVNPPYTEEELRSGKRQELTQRIIALH
jgi:hypothetical protein